MATLFAAATFTALAGTFQTNIAQMMVAPTLHRGMRMIVATTIRIALTRRVQLRTQGIALLRRIEQDKSGFHPLIFMRQIMAMKDRFTRP